MRVGICTIPSRLDNYTKDLVDCLKNSATDIKLFIDEERKGHTWNCKRMYREMLKSADQDEMILLCMDDCITIPKWKEYLQDLHTKAQTGIYVLFNRKRWHFKQENLDRGFSNGVHKGSYYDHAVAFVNQQDLPDKIDAFWETKKDCAEYNKRRGKHYDIVILDTLKHFDIEYTIATPTLFEHTGHISSLGHDIGESFNYIGDGTEQNNDYIKWRT